MTICVAAICKNFDPNDPIYLVVGAADRMLTAGNIEFEPELPKIIPITNSIFALLAGDSALQTEIVQVVTATVNNRITAEPRNWWRVSDVARLYSSAYSKALSQRGETSILAPLNLDHETFMQNQRTMAPELVKELAADLRRFQTRSSVAAIICGMDTQGTHIYQVKNSELYCLDSVGFAAIGAGDWHSNSQFMFAKHTRQRSFPETLLLTYAAKKRAEVAPGVGEATDMFVVGPGLGQNVYPLGDHMLKELEDIYTESQINIEQAAQKANKRIGAFVQDVINKAPQQQATTTPNSPEAAAASTVSPKVTTVPISPAPSSEPPPSPPPPSSV